MIEPCVGNTGQYPATDQGTNCDSRNHEQIELKRIWSDHIEANEDGELHQVDQKEQPAGNTKKFLFGNFMTQQVQIHDGACGVSDGC